MTQLPTHVVASALIRRVADAGGAPTVLAKGDRDAGALLLLCAEKGRIVRILERTMSLGGRYQLAPCGPPDTEDDSEVAAYWRRRRDRDPDLWVIELDIPNSERFAAETIAAG